MSPTGKALVLMGQAYPYAGYVLVAVTTHPGKSNSGEKGFASQLQLTVHHDGEITAAGA